MDFIKKVYENRLLTQMVFWLIMLVVVLQVGSLLIGSMSFISGMRNQIGTTTYQVADTVSQFVDGDNLQDYLKTGKKNATYKEMESRMQRLAENSECIVIYVATVNRDYTKRTYVYDVVSKASGFTPYEIGKTDPVEEEYQEEYKEVFEKGKSDELFIRSNNDLAGEFYTAVVPVQDSQGKTVAVCCVVKSGKPLEEAQSTYFQQIMNLFILITIIAIGGMGIYIKRRITMPIKAITEETHRFIEEQSFPEKSLGSWISNRNEIGDLAVAVDQMEKDIADGVRKLLKVTAEKNKISAELNVASSIQTGVLPKTFPAFPDRPEIDIYASMVPAKEVGGDFYDFFFIDEDHFCMVMADVSGKGIPAALFMMVSKTLLKTRAMQGGSPAEILMDVNDQICNGNDSEMFVTVWLGILNVRTGELVSANAGHENPAFCSEDGQFELKKTKHGFVIGGMEGMVYRNFTTQLEPGGLLYIYTDGVLEAINQAEEQYGEERMLEALNAVERSDAEPRAYMDSVTESLSRFTQDMEPFDDTTMLCLRYLGPSGTKSI